jgi:hypothetical protein
MKRKPTQTRFSRRNFLKTAAGASAGAMLIREPLWAQSSPAKAAANLAFPKIHQPFMITPKQALDWNTFKAQGGNATPIF